MKTANRLLAALLFLMPSMALALTFAPDPLFLAATEPRVMLVASRDHQLSMKAYTDYSDLNGDGILDTTYTDSIEYYGYFDSNKCYDYSSSRFNPSSAVTTGHHCDGTKWSGNFLNWASMTRMDVLRKTFYGGYRSTDTTTLTVLERHFLPHDVHAFVKVYNPGSNTTLKYYMPSTVVGSSNTAISLCNVSMSSSSTLTGNMTLSIDPSPTMPSPSIRVAAGAWPQWDSSEVVQCDTTVAGTQPTSVIGDYVARVKVCDASVGIESNCKTYTNPGTGVQTVKPTGLLQKYGDVDVTKRVRFGLMTGSYGKNKSGGVLRKNIGFIANNNNTAVTNSSVCGNNNANDEVDVCTGQFINNAANQAGIINTLNRLHIAGYNSHDNVHRYSCDSPGILSFTDGQCVDWGNPLSEIYLESLRYFAGLAKTSAFDAFAGSPTDTTILSSIPAVTWTDPLPATEWCALSSIVVLSTGLNSFDTDQLASFTPTGGSAVNAATLTQTVGDSSHEDINGHTYLIGDNGTTANNQCTAKTISNLATAKGICPQVPSLQGGYGIAGLAYAPKTIDLRPSYATSRHDRWTGVNEDWVLRQPINTYAVQLAETLPSFDAPVGSGTVTLLPACQANSDSSPGVWTPSSSGWRNCSMTNLFVDTNVAQASVGSDHTAKSNTCSGNGTTSKCFTVAWEDSTWGNDYDMDGIQRLGYCVGSACSTFKMLCPSTSSAYATIGPWSVGSGEMVVATCAIQANAGHTLTFGYTITGTTSDGSSFPIYRPGGKNFNVGNVLVSGITAATNTTFSQGASTAQQLKNPLWYAAKYGGFTESTPSAGTPNPNLTSEWDAVNNTTNAAGADGIPDNYYDVKNPANLYEALGAVFDKAAQTDAAASSVATTSTSLNDQSYIFQARFSPIDWSGSVLAYRINSSGVLTKPEKWSSADKLDAQSAASRVILTKDATDGVSFEWANLTASQKNALNANYLAVTDNCGPQRLNYLRGDATNEGDVGNFTDGSCSTAKFRTRSTKLGDIVNSNPWYVGIPSASYLSSVHPGYAAFRTRYAARTPVVYAGANDGMLHGFEATVNSATGEPTGTAGNELLAYVPSQVYSSLSWLTARNYNKNHHYLADGSPFSGDAYLNLASLGAQDVDKWRTVLVSGLNSGGKGYFALDVTNPADAAKTAPTFSTTNAASLLLWEFTNADDADMGYTYNLPPQSSINGQAKQIVKMENGKWAVVVGNGYNSSAGKAVLYILFIEDGVDGTWSTSDYVKLVADNSGANGLSTPVPFDTDGNGKADVIYAGDLKGNLWKFDVSGNDTTKWVVGTRNPSPNPSGVNGEGVALFQAKDASGTVQPIITPPEAVLHPNGGILVLFGTGKYLESSDVSSTQTQTFYGVWDNSWYNPSSGPAVIPLLRADLLAQTVTESGSIRTVSQHPYSDANADGIPDEKGWRIDLPTSKERVSGIPKVVNGILFFNTIIPSVSPCESGGTGWLMALSVTTGGMLGDNVFDTNGDTVVDENDTASAGMKVGMSPGGSLVIRGTGDALGAAVTNLTTGQLNDPEHLNLGAGIGGRVTWREILQ